MNLSFALIVQLQFRVLQLLDLLASARAATAEYNLGSLG